MSCGNQFIAGVYLSLHGVTPANLLGGTGLLGWAKVGEAQGLSLSHGGFSGTSPRGLSTCFSSSSSMASGME